MLAMLAEGGGHGTPALVEFVNTYIGEPVYRFQMNYTVPLWNRLFERLGMETNAEQIYGPYSPETAVPWWTVMFVLACLVSMLLIWVFKGRLSEDNPHNGQQFLEIVMEKFRGLLRDIVGPHGLKYLPVVATFGVLIFVANVMAFIPGLLPPTASVNVTFALGISSFIYYNYIGIKENGIFGHLKHFMGPVLFIAPLLFIIEVISNFVRPVSLGIRLFGNIFADEQVAATITNLAPPYSYWLLPLPTMALGLFVAFMQTFVFVFLSVLYVAEVSHHDDHEAHDDGQAEHAHDTAEGGSLTAPV